MKSELSDIIEFSCAAVQVYLFIGILGGLTRFRPGISTRAQRGWFISWPLIGMIYGQYIASEYRETSRQTVKIAHVPQETSTWDGLHASSEDDMTSLVRLAFGAAITHAIVQLLHIIFALALGAGTIGGVVAMAQQYLHFIEC
jgi:hypothetical protein